MHPLPILEGMTEPNHLLRTLRDQKLENCQVVRVFATIEEKERVSRVISRLSEVSEITWSATNWQTQRIPLRVIVQVTDKHFRAIAKIGFHYTLKQFPDLAGNEPEFRLLREFIRCGGNESGFVTQRKDQFVVNFLRGERPKYWMHILSAERTADRIISLCQFFAGPHCLPPSYEVSIGRDPARIARPRESRAHHFVYLGEESPEGYDGVMADFQPVQRVTPVWGAPPLFFTR